MEEKNGTGRNLSYDREVWAHMNPHLEQTRRIKLAGDILHGWALSSFMGHALDIEWAFARADMVPAKHSKREEVVWARTEDGFRFGWHGDSGRIQWFKDGGFYGPVLRIIESALELGNWQPGAIPDVPVSRR